eukprot:6179788-Pleurochrysis_carterae.AAC.1
MALRNEEHVPRREHRLRVRSLSKLGVLFQVRRFHAHGRRPKHISRLLEHRPRVEKFGLLERVETHVLVPGDLAEEVVTRIGMERCDRTASSKPRVQRRESSANRESWDRNQTLQLWDLVEQMVLRRAKQPPR